MASTSGGPGQQTTTYKEYRALTPKQNAQARDTFKHAAACLDPKAIEEKDNVAWIQPITNRCFAPTEDMAEHLYQAHHSSVDETARQVAVRHLFNNIVRADKQFGQEARYLYLTHPHSRCVPPELQYNWSGYKPTLSQRILRLSEVHPAVFTGASFEA